MLRLATKAHRAELVEMDGRSAILVGMVHTLEHHGLIKVPLIGDREGIYWLRFYRGAPRCVAVLTEVPGNPSLSVTNAISRVSAFVADRFSVDLSELIVFEIWPRTNEMSPAVKYLTFTGGGGSRRPGSRQQRPTGGDLPFTGRPVWWSSKREEIEELVGVALEALPSHSELYDAVKAMGGGTGQESFRRIYTAVAVEKLPPPHNPSRCHYKSRYEKLRRELTTQGVEDELEAGWRFWSTLSPETCAICRYHKADWAAIAEESVRVIDERGPRDDDHDYVAAAQGSHLPKRDKEWLRSLFDDPVVIAGGGYTNGQHRGCALHFSGAKRAAVVTDLESIGYVDTDEVYLGEG